MRSRAAFIGLAAAIALILAADVTAVIRHGPDTAGDALPGPLEAVLPELIAFVEQARGLQFKEPPDVELLDEQEFNTRLLAGEGEAGDEDEEEDFLGFLRALGLIDEEVDLEDVAEEQVGFILGFYDTEEKALIVRGTELTPYVKQVLVHELTHALEDQYFGLDREELGDDDGIAFEAQDQGTALDQGFEGDAVEALVEGSALVLEQNWFDSRPPGEQDAIEAEEEGSPVTGDPTDDVFTRLLSFPYAVGPDFVLQILDDGGQERLDAAFAQPPASTEQVLHPEAFLGGEGPRAVADPVADGEELERSSLGELGIILILDEAVEHDVALQAAHGWGGDRYVAWRDGDRTCVRWNIVMDTAQDTTEVIAALRSWVRSNPGATLRGSDPVELTSCG